MKNLEVALIFRDIARILEIKGDNPFRIRAYLKAAQNIEALTEEVEVLIKAGALTKIPGIGKDLEEKTKEIVSTGRLKFYEELKKTVPSGVIEMLSIPGVGPKTAKLLYEELGIKDIPTLEKMARLGNLKGLPHLKEKTEENIIRGIELLKKGRERMDLATAINISQTFVNTLKKLREVKNISPAGSLRRMKETVRDIDILVSSKKSEKIMDTFTSLSLVKEVLAKGPTKSSVLTKENIQVDIRVVEENSFGAALLYFTGSKEFNIKLRQIAQKKGLKINEYGVFKNAKRLAGKTELEIFKLLGLEFIEPELREDRGEIELAKENRLPKLVELSDIKGDFHVHSKWSDGNNSIKEMAEKAKALGYEYITITDHSQSLKVAGGLSVKELNQKRAEIGTLNKSLKGFRIFFGTEVDIDSEGKIDYKDEVLSEIDIVVAAIHSGFKQSKEHLTKRLIRACQNKHVDIIAHPTGRLWGTRDSYELDMDELLKVCRDTGTSLEINAFPQRLDLNDLNCKKAKELGVLLALGTDAHFLDQLEYMGLGLSVARRAGLEKRDILNTLSLEDLFKRLK